MELLLCAVCGRWLDPDEEDTKRDEDNDIVCVPCYEDESEEDAE